MRPGLTAALLIDIRAQVVFLADGIEHLKFWVPVPTTFIMCRARLATLALSGCVGHCLLPCDSL